MRLRPRSTIWPCVIAWLCVLKFLGICAAQAFSSGRPFDLERCSLKASLIVRGNLDVDGTIKVLEVMKGEMAPGTTVQLENGSRVFEAYRGRLKMMGGQAPAESGPVEAVAFLSDRREQVWQTVSGEAGIVVFEKDKVIVGYERNLWGGADLWQFEGYAPDSFKSAVALSIKCAVERWDLLATPHSSARTRALLDLALRQAAPVPLNDRFSSANGVMLHGVAKGLLPADSEDGEIALRMLQTTAKDRDRSVLIDLAGMVRWAGAFDAIVPFLDRKHVTQVRRSAMAALSQIDHFRSGESLGPCLTMDDPDLEMALICTLPHDLQSPQLALNIKAAESLAALAVKLRVLDDRNVGGDVAADNAINGFSNLAESHFHPRFVPIMLDWGLDRSRPHGRSFLAILRRLSGLNFEDGDVNGWRTWWTAARAALERNYDLRTPAGLADWMRSWKAADEATRGILMRLWNYEPQVDEHALLAAAAENETARFVLAELWTKERLSVETRKAIVEKYLRFKLTEKVGLMPQFPAWRECKCVAETDFPFPEAAWVGTRVAVSLSDREPKIDERDSGRSRSLKSANGSSFGGVGGSFEGSPLMRAVIELREKEIGGKVLWTIRWTPEPLQLQKLPK